MRHHYIDLAHAAWWASEAILAPLREIYAGSGIWTSENSSSTHSVEGLSFVLEAEKL
jgi:hypothetical protein